MRSTSFLSKLVIFLAFLSISSPFFAQGKSKKGVEEQEKMAYQFYQQGNYKDACDIFVQTTRVRSGEHYSRILHGLFIFMLVDAMGIFFFLYIEKRKAYRLLVEKNKECASRPVINPVVTAIDSNLATNPHEQELLQQIQQLFETEKIYLDSELTIETLSTKLRANRTLISKIINQYIGCNFPTLLNHYRVNEAIRLLTHPETQKYKMEAIGLMAGYNNRQVFHNAFKKETGLTPMEFKNVSQSID